MVTKIQDRADEKLWKQTIPHYHTLVSYFTLVVFMFSHRNAPIEVIFTCIRRSMEPEKDSGMSY